MFKISQLLKMILSKKRFFFLVEAFLVVKFFEFLLCYDILQKKFYLGLLQFLRCAKNLTGNFFEIFRIMV